MQKTLRDNRSGFTIVEMLVAFTVFLAVTTIAVNSFISLLRTQKDLSLLISAQSNASLAMEQMLREIRTGMNFTQTAPGSSDIYFTNANGQVVAYRLIPDLHGGVIDRIVGVGGGPLTSRAVNVVDLRFELFGATVGDNYPPRITIAMSVAPAGTRDLDLPLLFLQTTVSAREFDE